MSACGDPRKLSCSCAHNSCAPAPEHRRRSDASCRTKPSVGRRAPACHVLMSEQADQREHNQEAGVVLRIASSDQCLCVSKPKCLTHLLEGSFHLPAPYEPRDDLRWLGSRSVHSRAWVSNSSSGSRIRTQRNGTAATRAVPECRLGARSLRCAFVCHTSLQP